MKKKTILVFVFNGFADFELACMLSQINGNNLYQVKTIAVDKASRKSQCGFSIMPDLDFIPHVDLPDIDADTIAMVVVPEGDCSKIDRDSITLLVDHCVEQIIPILKWKDFCMGEKDSKLLKQICLSHAVPA